MTHRLVGMTIASRASQVFGNNKCIARGSVELVESFSVQPHIKLAFISHNLSANILARKRTTASDEEKKNRSAPNKRSNFSRYRHNF
jgi:hypothetical protein